MIITYQDFLLEQQFDEGLLDFFKKDKRKISDQEAVKIIKAIPVFKKFNDVVINKIVSVLRKKHSNLFDVIMKSLSTNEINEALDLTRNRNKKSNSVEIELPTEDSIRKSRKVNRRNDSESGGNAFRNEFESSTPYKNKLKEMKNTIIKGILFSILMTIVLSPALFSSSPDELKELTKSFESNSTTISQIAKDVNVPTHKSLFTPSTKSDTVSKPMTTTEIKAKMSKINADIEHNLKDLETQTKIIKAYNDKNK